MFQNPHGAPVVSDFTYSPTRVLVYAGTSLLTHVCISLLSHRPFRNMAASCINVMYHQGCHFIKYHRVNVSKSARRSGRFGFYLFDYTGNSLFTHAYQFPSHRPFRNNIMAASRKQVFCPVTHPFWLLVFLGPIQAKLCYFPNSFHFILILFSSPCYYYKILVHLYFITLRQQYLVKRQHVFNYFSCYIFLLVFYFGCCVSARFIPNRHTTPMCHYNYVSSGLSLYYVPSGVNNLFM